MIELFDCVCLLRSPLTCDIQAAGEVTIIRTFCENFSGDSVRFLMRGFTVAGDHPGQQSQGYRCVANSGASHWVPGGMQLIPRWTSCQPMLNTKLCALCRYPNVSSGGHMGL
eukprot:GHVT01005093.1.p2 GENE.GHVT01005093.1~~GHVT01005093.1.p2  ORF type:complete len:112 (+),score=3.45 GHVT01005093.1:696-1031(+)